MTKPIPSKVTITWKHVVLTIVCVWLLATLIGGEVMSIGSFEIGGMGCKIHGENFSRSVDGLPTKPK